MVSLINITMIILFCANNTKDTHVTIMILLSTISSLRIQPGN